MDNTLNDPKMAGFGKVMTICIIIFIVSIAALFLPGCIDSGNPQKPHKVENKSSNIRNFDLPSGKKLISFSLDGGPLFVTEDMEPDYKPTTKKIYGVGDHFEMKLLFTITESND